MGYTAIDIEKLIDPSIECGDRLAVNMQKWKLLVLLVSLLGFFLIYMYWVIQDSDWHGIIVMSLSIASLSWACYSVAVMYNPMLAIDKSGIAIGNKFYSWDSIKNIIFEKSGNRKKARRISVHLKNRGLIIFFIPVFLDQRTKVIATYIVKFFKPVQAKA